MAEHGVIGRIHAPWLTLDSHPTSQATRNGIRVSDLRDFEVFADKLRKLALDGAKRFEGFEYDVEADLEAYLKIIPRVLPLITDTVQPWLSKLYPRLPYQSPAASCELRHSASWPQGLLCKAIPTTWKWPTFARLAPGTLHAVPYIYTLPHRYTT